MTLDVVIMAGGLGKRMNSSRPKVLHLLKEKPLIVHVLENALKLNPKKILIIVGKFKDIIKKELEKYFEIDKFEFVNQELALGTGNAIQCAMPHLSKNRKILILSGDVPLLKYETMEMLLLDDEATIMVTKYENPKGYGRIIKDENEEFKKICEEGDCNEYEKKIKLVNAGVYCINSNILCDYLPQLKSNNNQNEYYLTDVFEQIKKNQKIKLIELSESKNNELLGVNTIEELEELEKLFIKNLE